MAQIFLMVFCNFSTTYLSILAAQFLIISIILSTPQRFIILHEVL